jgi:hypothetical protein
MSAGMGSATLSVVVSFQFNTTVSAHTKSRR